MKQFLEKNCNENFFVKFFLHDGIYNINTIAATIINWLIQ